MAATVYEQNKWFGRLQSMTYSYLPILVVMILVSALIHIVIEGQVTDLSVALTVYSGLVMMFWAIAFVAVYHFIVKRMLIANLSRLFRKISKNDNDLFVVVAEGKHSLFSRDQFVKESDRMSRSGTILPLAYAYKEYRDRLSIEFIQLIEVYDFCNAGHRACLEQYLKQLRGHIESLEAEVPKIAQRIVEVKAEEEKYRRYLVEQPA